MIKNLFKKFCQSYIQRVPPKSKDVRYVNSLNDAKSLSLDIPVYWLLSSNLKASDLSPELLEILPTILTKMHENRVLDGVLLKS